MKLFRKYDTVTEEESAGAVGLPETGFAPLLRLLKIAISQLSHRTARRRVCHLSAGYIDYTSIASVTPTAIKWDRRGEVFNAESYAHDTDGRATKIFILQQGVHTVHAQITAAGSSTGAGILYGEIYKNGIAVPLSLFILNSDKSGELFSGAVTVSVHCMAGDYIELKGMDYDGITTDAATFDSGTTYITIIREL